MYLGNDPLHWFCHAHLFTIITQDRQLNPLFSNFFNTSIITETESEIKNNRIFNEKPLIMLNQIHIHRQIKTKWLLHHFTQHKRHSAWPKTKHAFSIWYLHFILIWLHLLFFSLLWVFEFLFFFFLQQQQPLSKQISKRANRMLNVVHFLCNLLP